MKNLMLILFCLSTFSGLQAQLVANVYEDPNIERTVASHKTIAILPVDCVVKDVKSNEKNRLSKEEMDEMEKEYREAFQNTMYTYFLKMKKKGKLAQEVQDINRTNLMLSKAGLETTDQILGTPMEEVCEILGVDAVFYGNVVTVRSFSKGGATALAVFTGVAVKTGDADVSMKLYEGKEGKMIWSFDRTVASSYANTPESIVEYLMKRVSKRFPYKG